MPSRDSEGSYLLCELQHIGRRVNLLRVAAHQRPGLETRHRDARSVVKQSAGAFFMPAVCASWRPCAGDIRVCRVVSVSVSSLRTAATHRLETMCGRLSWSSERFHTMLDYRSAVRINTAPMYVGGQQ